MSSPADIRQVAVLGATGSIGTSALDVIARHPERLRASVLAAGGRVDALLELCIAHCPDHAVIADPACFARLRDGLREAGVATEAHAGNEALEALVAGPDCDTVVAAIVGAAGLGSTLAAARAGKRLLLANKEALVVGGGLFMQAVRDGGATLLPIDSEHSAIFQCLPEDPATWADRVDSILLTASGGPFRQRDPATLSQITPAQACAHPNFSMGRKISVDSATMMNKALEVIEARWLFDLHPDQIKVVIHPQQIIHSMVQFNDGSIKAQMGLPDMKLPIQYALAYPERVTNDHPRLDFTKYPRLSFLQPDLNSFPNLALAYKAIEAGGSMPCVLNAANEVVVDAFLKHRIGFNEMSDVIAATMGRSSRVASPDLADFLEIDRQSRMYAEEAIENNNRVITSTNFK